MMSIATKPESDAQMANAPVSVDADRWAYLGMCRFCLASVVVATHLATFVHSRAVDFVGSAAFEAILGFLVVSGFSIANSYRRSPDGYFRRRLARIYPVFAVALIASMVVGITVERMQFGPLLVAENALFLNGLVTSRSIVWASWTLAIEVWLYCLAPLFGRCSDRQVQLLTGTSLAVFVAYTVGRSAFHWPYYSDVTMGIGFLCLAFAWLAGWNRAVTPSRALGKATSLIVVALATTVIVRFGTDVVHHAKAGTLRSTGIELGAEASWAVAVLALPVIVLTAARLPRLTGQLRTLFSVLGDISYPLYLVHLVALKVAKAAGLNGVPILAATCICSAGLVFVTCDWYSLRRYVKRAKKPLEGGGS